MAIDSTSLLKCYTKDPTKDLEDLSSFWPSLTTSLFEEKFSISRTSGLYYQRNVCLLLYLDWGRLWIAW